MTHDTLPKLDDLISALTARVQISLRIVRFHNEPSKVVNSGVPRSPLVPAKDEIDQSVIRGVVLLSAPATSTFNHRCSRDFWADADPISRLAAVRRPPRLRQSAPFPSVNPALIWPQMATPARTGALAAAAGWTRAAAWAPDWRGAFSTALAREVEQRRFFLWIPVAAMGGVALNLAADREPVMWLPALMTALFAALAWFCRAPAARSRPLARNRRAVRRFLVDVAAHGAGRRAGARSHPHCLAARLSSRKWT